MFFLLFLLNLFFISIDLLGAFKTAGTDLGKELLSTLVKYPSLGLFIGIIITSIVQSSSATTSLVVAFAAGGLFGENMLDALYVAVPVLMGANIGTSVTNMLVSLGHFGSKVEFERAFSCATVHDFFNLFSVIVFLPLQLKWNIIGYSAKFMTGVFVDVEGVTFTSPLKAIVSPQSRLIRNLCQIEFLDTLIIFTVVLFVFFLVFRRVVERIVSKKGNDTWIFFFMALGMGLFITVNSSYPDLFKNHMFAQITLALSILFTALILLVKTMKSLVLTKFETLLHKYVFKKPLRALMLGMIFTAIIQSSSATTSLIIPLCGAGILNIYQIYPYTLGANVGTTITAIMASLATSNPIPLSMAFGHLLFNIFGIFVWFVIKPLQALPIGAAKIMGSLAVKYRYVPFVFIVFIFYLLPFLLIYLFK